MAGAVVLNYEIFGKTMQDVTTVRHEISETVSKSIHDCEEQLLETEQELMYSNELLQIAFAVEAEKYTLWQIALAELEAAIASGDPIAIADATAKEEYARAEYREAVRHREAMQERVRMANECVYMARERLQETSSTYNHYSARLDETIHVQFDTIIKSDARIKEYLSTQFPAVLPTNGPGGDKPGGNGQNNQKRQLEKQMKDYFDDLKNKSEFPDTIPDKPFGLSDIKKRTPEENAEMRDEFDDKKTQLKKEWEKANGRPWPKYKQDVYSSNGKLIRKAGSDYDAHHIQPLGMGGKNEASNITPMNAEVHYDKQGVHAPDSPYSKLDQMLGGMD